MAILAFGSGMKSLAPPTYSASTLFHSTTAARLAPYCSEGIHCVAASTAYPTVEFTDSSDFWISFYSYSANHPASWSPIIIYDGTTPLFQIDCDSTTTFAFEYWNGSIWVEVAADISNAFSATVSRHDIHIVMHNTTGTIDWYKDGVLQQSFGPGDTIYTASTTCNKATFHNNGAAGTHYQVVSAVIVADEDTRSMVYAQRLVTGNGALTDFTGDYTAIDEAGLDDTDFISSALSGDQSTFTCPAISTDFASGYDVVAVGVNARAKEGVTFPGDIKLLTRSGTTLGSSSTVALSGSFQNAQGIFATDPATASAWTVSAADGSQIGAESV